MPAVIAAAAPVVKAIAGLFGKKSKVGPLWDRMQYITTGETLTEGGNKVDSAYKQKIDIQWATDLPKTWDKVVQYNVVWKPYGAGAQDVFTAAQQNNPSLSGYGAVNKSSEQPTGQAQALLGTLGTTPMLVMIGLVLVGALLLIFTGKKG